MKTFFGLIIALCNIWLMFLTKEIDWGWVPSVVILLCFPLFSMKKEKSQEKEDNGDTKESTKLEPTVWVFKLQTPMPEKFAYTYFFDNKPRVIESSVDSLAKLLKIYADQVVYRHGGEFKFIFSPPCEFFHSLNYANYSERYSEAFPLSEDEKKLFIEAYSFYRWQ